MIDNVVILAAGLGTRMSEVTHEKPKCMAPFLGGTIIDRLLAQVLIYKPKRIIIVTGHHSEVLKAHLLSRYESIKFTFCYNQDYALTNSFESALLGLCLSSGSVIIFNSDVVYDDEIIRKMIVNPHPFCISIDKSTYDNESEKVCLDCTGSEVVHMAKTISEADADGCSADLYKIYIETDGSGFLQTMKRYARRKNANKGLFEDFLDQAFLLYSVHAVDISDLDWYEIDKYSELLAAEEIFQKRSI